MNNQEFIDECQKGNVEHIPSFIAQLPFEYSTDHLAARDILRPCIEHAVVHHHVNVCQTVLSALNEATLPSMVFYAWSCAIEHDHQQFFPLLKQFHVSSLTTDEIYKKCWREKNFDALRYCHDHLSEVGLEGLVRDNFKTITQKDLEDIVSFVPNVSFYQNKTLLQAIRLRNDLVPILASVSDVDANNQEALRLALDFGLIDVAKHILPHCSLEKNETMIIEKVLFNDNPELFKEILPYVDSRVALRCCIRYNDPRCMKMTLSSLNTTVEENTQLFVECISLEMQSHILDELTVDPLVCLDEINNRFKGYTVLDQRVSDLQFKLKALIEYDVLNSEIVLPDYTVKRKI